MTIGITRLIWLLTISAVFLGSPTLARDYVEFTYEQTDATTGIGELFGIASGVVIRGDMPAADVSQNDISELNVPEGMIGYVDEVLNGNPGNEFGVHLDWPDTATVRAERIIDATTMEVYDLEIDLVYADDGLSDATWSWEFIFTDDVDGNDAFGEGSFRTAAWVGDARNGHRHSAGAFGELLEGEAENFIVNGGFGNVGSNGQGDAAGLTVGLRDGVFDEGSGPLYVDNVKFTGGFDVDLSRLKLVGTEAPADFNGDGNVDLADFSILAESFNVDGTSRTLSGDMTADARTDLRDFVLFREAFRAAQPAAIPEPTSAFLMLNALIALLAMRRRANG